MALNQNATGRYLHSFKKSRTETPRKEDDAAYRDLLQYFAGTITLGIPFGRDPTKGLEGFVDASYADAEDSKSTEAR